MNSLCHGQKCLETGKMTKSIEHGKCQETGKMSWQFPHLKDFVVSPVSTC